MNDVDQNINPMVRIDGPRIKELRERKGLTQLYVATAVGVTTDTISRWENRRYPSIMGENAEKLAAALEVEVSDILDRQEEMSGLGNNGDFPPEPQAPKLPPRLKRHLLIIAIIIAILVVFQVVKYFASPSQSVINITASRTLPPHVPAGQLFPVLVRVDTSEPVSFSLIIRDTIPAGCEPVDAVPPFTSTGKEMGLVKWVYRLDGKSQVFAYLLKGPVAEENTPLDFSGQVLVGRQKSSPVDILGDNRLTISNFHWADHNRDSRIDDEEILVVYDLFSDIEGFALNRDLVDEIWASGGYSWNGQTGQYEVLP